MVDGFTLLVIAVVGFIIVSLWLWMNMALVRKARVKQFNEADSDEDEGSDEEAIQTAPVEQTVHLAEAVEEVEVVGRESGGRGKVFGKPTLSFYLSNTSDSLYYTDLWIRTFEQLTQNRDVLGWTAFDESTLIAADHAYDKDLVDVLCGYKSMMARLQKEVGLSRVTEASLVGDEGKMWFITGRDTLWFALFLDKNVEANEIIRACLMPALNQEPAH